MHGETGRLSSIRLPPIIYNGDPRYYISDQLTPVWGTELVRGLKSERHHWWPECVSEFWKNDEGCVHWLWPNGKIVQSPPKNFGVIGNGHQIRLGCTPEEITVWDESFERDFQTADENFPAVIRWLQELERRALSSRTHTSDRFVPISVEDERLYMLSEGIISLAVRSPANREAAVSVAEHYRGPLPERERNKLIAINIRSSHREAVKQIGIRGKFVAIYSPARELIFGDGFYHNIRSPVNSLYSPRILAPLTPHIAVLFVRPTAYTPMPRFFTLVIDSYEAEELNHAVQVYSRDKIFYRSEKPEVDDAYVQSKHMEYSGLKNPIENLIRSIPGTQSRSLLGF